MEITSLFWHVLIMALVFAVLLSIALGYLGGAGLP